MRLAKTKSHHDVRDVCTDSPPIRWSRRQSCSSSSASVSSIPTSAGDSSHGSVQSGGGARAGGVALPPIVPRDVDEDPIRLLSEAMVLMQRTLKLLRGS
jgi:hypothetical protein